MTSSIVRVEIYFTQWRRNEQNRVQDCKLSIGVVPCCWGVVAQCSPAGGRWHHQQLTYVSPFYGLLLKDWSSPKS